MSNTILKTGKLELDLQGQIGLESFGLKIFGF